MAEFIEELLRGRPSLFPSIQELNDLILGRFPHLVLESSGTIDVINPRGSSFEEALRSYRGIISSLQQPTSMPMYEVAEDDDAIEALSGHSEPEDWDLSVSSEHPYVMLDDYSYHDIVVNQTVVFPPPEGNWSGHDPLDYVPCCTELLSRGRRVGLSRGPG